jgi:hypothetical protein
MNSDCRPKQDRMYTTPLSEATSTHNIAFEQAHDEIPEQMNGHAGRINEATRPNRHRRKKSFTPRIRLQHTLTSCMHHCNIVGLSVNKDVTSGIAHEAPTAAAAKLTGPLTAYHAPSPHLGMPLTVVETPTLQGAETSAGHIDANEGLHQILRQGVVPDMSHKDLQAHSLNVLFVNDVSVLQAPVHHKCQSSVPPLI